MFQTRECLELIIHFYNIIAFKMYNCNLYTSDAQFIFGHLWSYEAFT